MNSVKFSRKTLPQKEGLGEKLAKKRVSLGLTIRDVEKETRVRSDYIEDIEAGKYDRLPPHVFVKGFLKAYASLLKLDPDKVLKLYLKERGLSENVKKAAANPPVVKPLKGSKVIITPKTFVITGIVFVALLIVAYIIWQVSILTAPPTLTLKTPAGNTTVKTDSIELDGKTDPSSNLYINDVEVGVDENGNFSEDVNLQSGVNNITVKSQNSLGKSNIISRIIVAQIPTLAPPSQIAQANVTLKLTIGPKSASVQVQTDGKELTAKPVVMLAGVSQTYTAMSSITVITNNGGSVSADLNGQELGVLGKEGVKASRTFGKSS
jgi:cytoskeletal protein RodZ